MLRKLTESSSDTITDIRILNIDDFIFHFLLFSIGVVCFICVFFLETSEYTLAQNCYYYLYYYHYLYYYLLLVGVPAKY